MFLQIRDLAMWASPLAITSVPVHRAMAINTNLSQLLGFVIVLE